MALIFPSAACGRNQGEGFGWARAISRQWSAFSLAFSIQLLHQHGNHAFDLNGLRISGISK